MADEKQNPLLERIFAEAGLTLQQVEELPLDTTVAAAKQVWKIGSPKANDPSLIVFFIFSGNPDGDIVDYIPGDARVYLAPTDAATGNPFTTFVVNRGSDTGYRASAMTGNVWVRAVAAELRALAEDKLDLVECENDACNALTTLAEGVTNCRACGKPIIDDVIDDTNEDNDADPNADETPTNPQTPMAKRPAIVDFPSFGTPPPSTPQPGNNTP